MVAALPSGTVTFAFVDVVGSTSALAEHGDAFVGALAGLHELIADCAVAHGGVVVKTEGDGAFLAFGDAGGAVRALVEMQERVEAAADGDSELRLRVRAGAHAGPAQPVAGDYVALAVNVAARVTSAAGAGQVLVTPAVVELLRDPGLVAAAGEPVGEYALKDVQGPMALHRVAGGEEAPRAAPYRRTNVAEPVTSFVGREAELAELRDLVGARRLVTVVGPGGMGKTRLTSQLVLEVADSYDAGAWLVELASVSQPDQVLGQVAAAVGSSATTAGELAAELARRGPLLVLLDNCEHVIDAAAEVAAELLPRAPAIRIVATSRAALQVAGEVVWRIPALPSEDSGCALFAHRFGAATGRGMDALDRSEVVELCERLDGSPLAIELASVQASEVPVADLLDLVREGTESLALRGGGRQSSLDAVVAWSLDRLDTPDREALLVLSQAPARLTAEEARLLIGPVAEQHHTTAVALLRDLVRVSLVDLDGAEYRLLDTIRAAARRALRGDPALHSRARVMLHQAAARLASPNNDYNMADFPRTGPRPDWVQLLEEAVLDAWQDRTPGLGSAWNLLGVVATYAPVTARLRATALEVLGGPPGPGPIGPDDALRYCGAFFMNAYQDPHRIPWTVAEIERFVDAVIAGSPPHVAARAANTMTHYFIVTDRLDEAARCAELGSELADRTGSPIFQAYAAAFESLLADKRGEREGTLRHAERALALKPETEWDHPIAVANVGEALGDLGRYDEALMVLRQGLDRRPATYHRWALTINLAGVLFQSGATDEAFAVARELRAELDQEPEGGPATTQIRYAEERYPDLFDSL